MEGGVSVVKVTGGLSFLRGWGLIIKWASESDEKWKV